MLSGVSTKFVTGKLSGLEVEIESQKGIHVLLKSMVVGTRNVILKELSLACAKWGKEC